MIGRNVQGSKGDPINIQKSRKEIIIRNPKVEMARNFKKNGFRLFSVVCYAEHMPP